MIVYYAVLGAFIAVASANVTWQVWAPAFRQQPKEPCGPALSELAVAVDRARNAASLASADGEDAAIASFRAALLPEWGRRDAIAASCRKDRKLSAALDTIERLRYAEERAVRREVAELAPLRQKVKQIVAGYRDATEKE
jgi:hypothetical protein